MSFTSWMFRNRPDQTVDTLNEMLTRLDALQSSIRVVSKDKKNVIIIGEGHPVDPNTGRPYSFGIRKYRIRGDKLELEHDYE